MADERRGITVQSMRDKVRQRSKERAASSGGGGSTLNLPDGVKFIELKKDGMLLDIIPYKVKSTTNPEAQPGEMWYKRVFFIHRNIGAENKMIVCPARTFNKPCPICEDIARLRKDSSVEWETIKPLVAKERNLYNVADAKDHGAGVMLLEMSHHLFQKHLDEEVNNAEDDWAAGFADIKDGCSLKIRFSEEKMGKNTFLEVARIDFEERKPLTRTLLGQVIDLDSILKVLPYDTLASLYFGADDSEAAPDEDTKAEKFGNYKEEEYDADNPPARKRKLAEEEEEEKPAPRRRPVAKEEEPEEEEKPVPRRRREPVEEEKPAPKAKGSSPKCPGGGTFGNSKDLDAFDECMTCEVWEACKDKAEG